MLNLNNKKAMANQIDWAISMAIFLLFIIWFFIIIQQYIPLQARLESDILTIEERFKENISFTYMEVPFYITAEQALSDVPVIVNNPVNWTNYIFNNNIYATRDGTKIFFIADVKQGSNVVFMKSSQRTYQPQQPNNFIANISESVLIDSKLFNPRFQDSVLKDVYFNSTRFIEQISFSMNGEELTSTAGSSLKKDIFYKAQSLYDWFTVTSYVFSDNSFVTSFFDIYEGLSENATFAITATMPMMTDYATDIFSTSELNFDNGCISQTSDILNLIDSTGSITYIFDQDINFTICDVSNVSTEKISVEAAFDYDAASGSESIPFMIFANEDTYADAFSEIVTVDDLSVGTVTSFTGISKTALNNLALLSESELYSMFNISTSKSFAIDVFNSNNTAIFSFSSGIDDAADVFSRSFSDYLVDAEGNKERVLIHIKVW